MVTKLVELPINTDSDIFRAHDLTIQLARWAEMSIPDQIRFAATVADGCTRHYGDIIILQIHRKETGYYFLQAVINNSSLITEKEIYEKIVIKELPVFDESLEQRKNSWEKNYYDMQQFTFALAHDLQNSLTKLKLALSLIEDEKLPSSIERYMHIIYRAADRVEEIMISLNKIIRLGDSSPDVVKTISPAEVFADVYDEFADNIAKTGAIITTDFSSVPSINYIAVYLKSIFSNLLGNAIKYASPSRPLRLSIFAHRQGNRAAFIFTDNGQGIDLDAAGGRLFLPFTRFSTITEGSGIGLYLIKNIIERNGGSIKVESTLNEGTTFHVYLREYTLPSAN